MPVRLIRLEIGSMYNQSLSIDGDIVVLQNVSMEHWFRLPREKFKVMFILHGSRLVATFGTVLSYRQEAFKIIEVEGVVYRRLCSDYVHCCSFVSDVANGGKWDLLTWVKDDGTHLPVALANMKFSTTQMHL